MCLHLDCHDLHSDKPSDLNQDSFEHLNYAMPLLSLFSLAFETDLFDSVVQKSIAQSRLAPPLVYFRRSERNFYLIRQYLKQQRNVLP